MDNNRKMMNVLVLGNSGAGKSTLIKAVSGVNVISGVGEGVTQNIGIYESSNWPIKFIDTKGFEYNVIEQWKTIHQVKKYTKSQISGDNNIGIDAVWYCIDGTVRRTFEHNVNLMNKAIKGWKNIPVFAVITKSYSEVDIPENIEAVRKIFSNNKNINLKEIIPVVAQEYKINDEIIVEPKGIEDLCLKTLDCLDEAKNISRDNRNRMILNQKRFTTQGVISAATASAVAVGVAPIPSSISDSTILVPIEVGLTKGIFKIYGVPYSNLLIDKIIGSVVITVVAKQIVQAIPIVGPVANGVVAGSIVFALGEGVMTTSEAIYSGKIDPNKVEEVAAAINKAIQSNAIIGAVSNYFETNKDKIKDKKPNEILNDVLKSIKKNK